MTYGFPTSDIGYIQVRANKTLAVKFVYPAHEQNNYRLDHCMKVREKRV